MTKYILSFYKYIFHFFTALKKFFSSARKKTSAIKESSHVVAKFFCLTPALSGWRERKQPEFFRLFCCIADAYSTVQECDAT